MRAVLLLMLAVVFPAHARDQWTEVRTDHFTIVGNARVSELREQATRLERIRSVFRSAFEEARDPPVPIVVFVVRREDDLRPLAPSLWRGGQGPAAFFQDVRMRFQIGIRLDARDPYGAAFHEYHHVLANVTEPNLPMWLREGLAGLWGEAAIDGSRVEVGRLVTSDVHAIASRIRLDSVALIRSEAPSHMGPYYAEAKLFTHLLRFGPADDGVRFDSLLDRIRSGMPPERALAELYGPLDELQRTFVRYVKQDAFAFMRIDLASDPASSASWVVRALSEAEALACRGEFLRLGGGGDLEARSLFERALRHDRNEPRALANLAVMSPPVEARALITRLESRSDASWEAHWLAARVLTSASAGDAAISAHLAAVTARAPGFAPGWIQLAALRSASDPESAMEMLDRAIELDPSRPELIVRLARLLDERWAKESTAIAAEASRRASAMPDSWPARRVCAEGAVFGAAVLAACDSAIDREPGDWRTHDARGIARAFAGDLRGALADLRDAKRGASAGIGDRTSRDESIRALEAGVNPFPAAPPPIAAEWAN